LEIVYESAAFPQYYTSNQDKRAAHYGNPPLCFGLHGQEGPPDTPPEKWTLLSGYFSVL
jgi:hypothetical protein